ncbi:MAG: PDZ domain-containing protein [Deltaproteobacteria bacterium]|nr:PDZ domain-containing protein [Deltaproteobacteria bacterium]
MRVLLFLALSGAVAHADDAKPADPHPADAAAPAAPTRAKVPLRVVRMLPETKQALLFDRTKGTHVVVESGQAVEGYLVDSIDDDEVTLLSDSGATVVLAAPDPAWRHRRDGESTADAGKPAAKPAAKPATAATTAKSGEPQPADPYADLAVGGELGTGADGVRVVEAPDAPAMAPTSTTTAPAIGTGADGVRVVEAPGAPATATVTAPATATAPVTAAATVPATATATVTATEAATATVPASVPASVPATASAPATVPASVPAPAAGTDAAKIDHYNAGVDALAAALTGAPAPAPAAGAAGTTVLARADVKAALASFGTLAGSIRGSFTPVGVRVDSVAAGSLFAKAGLQAGDVVSAVDGAPLRSLDDAADLYARAGTAKVVSASVMRSGKPMTLRVAIQ